MDASKVALGLTLTAPFVPMLWMGEEFAATAPFLYFADHEEEEMRRLVSEGRKRDFAAFGWDENEVPDPEDVETFQRSKVDWNEVRQGKHEEMFSWVKALIRYRRTCMDLNDGDFNHMTVSCSHEGKSLTMQRGAVRVLMNLGEAIAMPLLKGECLKLASTEGIAIEGDQVKLPKMSLAILQLD